MRLTELLELRVDGRPVALARMLLAFALAVCILESAAVLRGIAEGKLRYPVSPIVPAPTTAAVQIYLVVGVVAAVCLLLGLFAGASAAAGSVLLASALLWDQQTYSSHHFLVVLLLAYLAFARSGRRWGVAALRNPERTSVPWWPQLLMMTQVSALYLFAGVSKINPLFLSGEPLQAWMWMNLPLPVFQALAIATITTEVFLAVALWIPRLRLIAIVAGLGLHVSIVVGLTDQTLVLIAFGAATLATYWLFLSRPSLRLDARMAAFSPAGMTAQPQSSES